MAKLSSLTINDTGSLTLSNSAVNDVYIFRTVGTTSWTCPQGVTQVEVLVVAGGGGGGYVNGGGGGGGGGGVIYNSSVSVTPGTSYTVTVGGGGAPGNNGGNSVFGSLTAIGGGGGGAYASAGLVGGSGGGAGRDAGATVTRAAGTAGQGFAGGICSTNSYGAAGGGGGAGQQGYDGGMDNSNLPGLASRGGDGLVFNISGTPCWYGGGGGGSWHGTDTRNLSSQGGFGGGGAGSGRFGTAGATSGTPNTGGGGGGSDTRNVIVTTGYGGSGIVIIRTVPLPYTTKVDVFKATGTTSWTCPTGVTAVEVLVVAGGGGGGCGENNQNGGGGGGGGGGGLLYNSNYAVTPGTSYTVTVGAGGAASSSSTLAGNNGGNSVFGSLTAIGGGGGGGGDFEAANAGAVGGSGGGAGGDGNYSALIYSLGTPGQGYPGGARNGLTNRAGQGGGGAGGPGSSGTLITNNTGTGGKGGDGLMFNITGTPTWFAGGGGGGGSLNFSSGTTNSIGGLGGGAPGGGLTQGFDAQSNTGGGGGGGYGTGSGAGGSGIVIVRYSVANDLTTANRQIKFNSAANSVETFGNDNTWMPQSLGEPIVTKGLTFYIDPAKYISGSQVSDLSGNGNHGTFVGASYGRNFGGYFDLSSNTGGSGSSATAYIDIPPAAVPTENQFTYCFWVYGFQATQQSIFNAQTYLNSQPINIHLPWVNNVVYFDCGFDTALDRISKYATDAEYQGWHYWCFTKNIATGTAEIHLDGQLWHSGTGLTKKIYQVNAASIGRYVNAYGTKSYVGPVKFYNRVLTQAEIKQNYEASIQRFKPSTEVKPDVLNLEFWNPKSYPRTGATVNDLSGNGRNVTLYNSPTFDPAWGGYLTFNGSNQYGLFTTINMCKDYRGSPWTVSAWFYTATTANDTASGAILSNQSGGPVGNSVCINGGKAAYWYYHFSWYRVLGNKTINDSQWHLVHWVARDGALLDIYVDGVLDISNQSVPMNSSGPVDKIAGSYAGTTSGNFDGRISEIKVWSRALSPTEVLQHYKASSFRYGK